MRIGHGIDVHAFSEGVRDGEAASVRLGGVDVPFERALEGHSDGDALLHAIVDALLGAAALGDIGGMFPSSDERWRGADSLELLRLGADRVREAGFAVGNVDATVVAQAPRITPYASKMREAVAAALNIDISRVSVKATTSDGLGFTGRGEGIAAFATVLLE
jgi:2-C-methyl-D-erythritol 2,4-cyclodiphosphate synthase